jgi:hypothetical protein
MNGINQIESIMPITMIVKLEHHLSKQWRLDLAMPKKLYIFYGESPEQVFEQLNDFLCKNKEGDN